MAQVPTPELIEYFLAHLDDNKKKEIIAVYVPCLFFAYTAVILRFVSRRLIKTAYQWDDWTIVIGLVGFDPETGISAHSILKEEVVLHISLCLFNVCFDNSGLSTRKLHHQRSQIRQGSSKICIYLDEAVSEY